MYDNFAINKEFSFVKVGGGNEKHKSM